jgi:hypothetical protein
LVPFLGCCFLFCKLNASFCCRLAVKKLSFKIHVECTKVVTSL